MGKRTDLKIDAVAEVRRIRDAQHEELAGRSWEERAAFFRARAAELDRSLSEAGKLPARKPAV